jgi:hypothetical protein
MSLLGSTQTLSLGVSVCNAASLAPTPGGRPPACPREILGAAVDPAPARSTMGEGSAEAGRPERPRSDTS